MEEGNLRWENIPNTKIVGNSETELSSGKMYGALYDELVDKCNPRNFVEPYNEEKVNIANRLYDKLLKEKNCHKDYCGYGIREIRDQAIRELGISISDYLYVKLANYCNPKCFLDPYDYNAVQIANQFYPLIEESKDNISELEKLQSKILENEVLKSYYEAKEQRRVEVSSSYAWTFLFFGVILVLGLIIIIDLLIK